MAVGFLILQMRDSVELFNAILGAAHPPKQYRDGFWNYQILS